MKKTLFLLAAMQTVWLAATAQYWQQETNYKINVALDDKNHTLKGNLELEYTNNSPDKLDFIWFHLWPNAYKNENTAYAKQVEKGEIVISVVVFCVVEDKCKE